MDISCPKCGAENWLENQSKCLACSAILRRCTDCANYDASHGNCRRTGAEVDSYEAENPSLLSVSTNCLNYRHAEHVRGPG